MKTGYMLKIKGLSTLAKRLEGSCSIHAIKGKLSRLAITYQVERDPE
jgi:hypothetical protein